MPITTRLHAAVVQLLGFFAVLVVTASCAVSHVSTDAGTAMHMSFLRRGTHDLVAEPKHIKVSGTDDAMSPVLGLAAAAGIATVFGGPQAGATAAGAGILEGVVGKLTSGGNSPAQEILQSGALGVIEGADE